MASLGVAGLGDHVLAPSAPLFSRPGPIQEPVVGRGRRRRRLPAYSDTNDERAPGVTAVSRRGRPTPSRAWKALSRARLGPVPTPNWEVRADLHEPWLTARDRSRPFARARRGHGWLGQDHSR